MKLYEFFSVPDGSNTDKEALNKSHKTETEREKLASDVYWFILDHDRLHKEHFLPMAMKMHEDFKKNKKLDREKYTECWQPMVEDGCLEFFKKNKMKGNPKKVFDENFCKGICRRLAERHVQDIIKGEYKLGD